MLSQERLHRGHHQVVGRHTRSLVGEEEDIHRNLDMVLVEVRPVGEGHPEAVHPMAGLEVDPTVEELHSPQVEHPTEEGGRVVERRVVERRVVDHQEVGHQEAGHRKEQGLPTGLPQGEEGQLHLLPMEGVEQQAHRRHHSSPMEVPGLQGHHQEELHLTEQILRALP